MTKRTIAHGLPPEQADCCGDGLCGCPTCPWRHGADDRLTVYESGALVCPNCTSAHELGRDQDYPVDSTEWTGGCDRCGALRPVENTKGG